MIGRCRLKYAFYALFVKLYFILTQKSGLINKIAKFT